MLLAHYPAEAIFFRWGSSPRAEAIYDVLSGCVFFVISVLLGNTVVSNRIDGGQGVEVKQQTPCSWFTAMVFMMSSNTDPLTQQLQLLQCDFHQRSTPAACGGRFLPTGKHPFSHLLPRVVLSLHPTHIVHLLVVAKLSPTTNALTDRPNPANDSYKLELTQCSCHCVCFSPCRLDPHLRELSLTFSSCWPLFQTLLLYLLGSCVSLPVWLCWEMKIPLWYLVVLLACLFTPGRSDCQGECVACGLLLQQQQLQQAFNTMVSVWTCVCACRCESLVIRASAWSTL